MTPVTVTVWAVAQLALVNVKLAGATVASPVSDDSTDRTTSDGGWVSNTTPNVSVDSLSLTEVEPSDSVTVIPGPVPV